MAKPALIDPIFTTPPTSQEGILAWLKTFVEEIMRAFRNHKHTFPQVISGDLRVNNYVTANKPAAADAPYAIIFVSDGAAGAKFQGSDGTNWLPLG